ncbi:MAG: hypothetical protein ABIJ18_03705 [archaeon]
MNQHKCQVCHGDIAFKICPKCGKLVCRGCFLSKFNICIECGPQYIQGKDL